MRPFLLFLVLAAISQASLSSCGEKNATPPAHLAVRDDDILITVISDSSQEKVVGADVYIIDSVAEKGLAALGKNDDPSEHKEIVQNYLKNLDRHLVTNERGRVWVPHPSHDTKEQILIRIEKEELEGEVFLQAKTLEKLSLTVTLKPMVGSEQLVSLIDPSGQPWPRTVINLYERKSMEGQSWRKPVAKEDLSIREHYRVRARDMTGAEGELARLPWRRDKREAPPKHPFLIQVVTVGKKPLTREIEVAQFGKTPLSIECPDSSSIKLTFLDDLGTPITDKLTVLAHFLPPQFKKKFERTPSFISPQLSQQYWTQYSADGEISIFPIELGLEVGISAFDTTADRKYLTTRLALRAPSDLNGELQKTITMKRAPIVELLLTDAEGEPLSEQWVDYRGWDTSGWTEKTSDRKTTTKEGRFLFPLVNFEGNSGSRPFTLKWTDTKTKMTYEAVVDLGKKLKPGRNDLGRVAFKMPSAK